MRGAADDRKTNNCAKRAACVSLESPTLSVAIHPPLHDGHAVKGGPHELAGDARVLNRRDLRRQGMRGAHIRGKEGNGPPTRRDGNTRRRTLSLSKYAATQPTVVMVAIAKICFQEPRRHATAQRDQRREAKRVRGPAAERRSARRHRLCQGAIQNTSVMTCKLSPSQQRRREARRAPRTRPIAPHHPPRACKRFANSYRKFWTPDGVRELRTVFSRCCCCRALPACKIYAQIH
jgi:hypothetical protein